MEEIKSNSRIKSKYLQELEKNIVTGLEKQTTFVQRRKAVNYFFNFLDTHQINLKQLNSSHVQSFLHFLKLRITSRGTSLAPATIKQIYALTKSFYIYCYEKKIVLSHPDLIFTRNLVKQYKFGEKKLPKYIDQQQMKKLLDQSPDRWKPLLHFMYDTGARISEVLNIKIADIDFKKRLVKIFEPKTMNVRVTALSRTTVQLLQHYFDNHRPNPRKGYEEFVFINRLKRKMNPRAVQYVVKELSTKILGTKHAITPHYFRAACAVHLLESGVDIRQVQEIIGWKSLAVVQNYTRITPHRQTLLKEQHHPGFQDGRKDEEEKTKEDSKKRLDSTQSSTEVLIQQLLDERQEYRQELTEIKRKSQQQQQQINELLKEQQGLQQHLLRLLSQKSNNETK
ncbi:MAG: tyrosine-type recombinase/integrase [Candidatus Hodarchaeota archaeon]